MSLLSFLRGLVVKYNQGFMHSPEPKYRWFTVNWKWKSPLLHSSPETRLLISAKSVVYCRPSTPRLRWQGCILVRLRCLSAAGFMKTEISEQELLFTWIFSYSPWKTNFYFIIHGWIELKVLCIISVHIYKLCIFHVLPEISEFQLLVKVNAVITYCIPLTFWIDHHYEELY